MVGTGHVILTGPTEEVNALVWTAILGPEVSVHRQTESR